MTTHGTSGSDAAVSRHATVACPFCATLNRVDLSRLADRPRCGECKRPILLDRPIAVSDATVERVISGTDVPVVMDCYADWCGPCKIMAPILDDFARDRAGEVLVIKLDTDRNPATTQRLGIRAIPTLIVFRDGRESARQAGVLNRQQLAALVEAAARA
ncbi:MAG TPA: thioredoxin [Gemmatimonadales bacterium]|nr:thioredoxin [Gemmatimonadales bacterium]